MPLDGQFDLNGQTFRYQIVEIHTPGGDYSGVDIEDHIREADQVFYEATGSGETYHRWLGGPFEHVDDVELAIEEEIDVYEEATA
jgi:hypothetical protein